ncbi:Uncharacterized protein T05G5.1 [Toxocara canis]|uniref:Uncharacterized protein T05G5.1 n=2 Tax=Toxocara canis TaxID=6265 RepID=A0A0B2VAN9_TOXCA|nr:Uncharacterized protein T05G5.1 [Toxocara canis]VDM39454.1 unnamed protein product [Toxocara canis]
MRILCLMMCLLAPAIAQRKAFVNPQTECRIKCLNGGFCAYLVDNPSVHTCLCLVDMFTGDRCQYQVIHTTSGLPSSTKTTATTTTFAPPYYSDDNEDYTEPHTTVADVNERTREVEEEGDDDYTEGWDSVEDYGNEGDRIKQEEDESEDENKVQEQRHVDIDMVGRMESDSRTHGESHGPMEGRQRFSDRTHNDVSDDDDTFYKQETPTELPSFDIDSVRYSSIEDETDESEQMRFPPHGNSKSAEQHQQTSTERGLIPETEAEDDGWMMSKRRRIVSKSANTCIMAVDRSALLLLGAFAFLRWMLPPPVYFP